ncbi:FAD-binding protein [Tsukamurella sp. NPDC003166]|uniref:FAD-binding protein n=1 Tax=Tsukamurella sp. NPDC003166 TaxID=3154444 RepID=UPI0033BD016F
MTRRPRRAPSPETAVDDDTHLLLHADVLILGGGPAATWAAIAATERGAAVVLADKGYCGSSGVAATAGVGHWLVPPDPARRDQEITLRERRGGYLTDRLWTDAVLDEAWERTALLPEWGMDTAPSSSAGGRTLLGRAPDYLRFLCGRVKKGGATILDHSPALELLVTADGAVAGARGHQRQRGRDWVVTAGAVVLATGGTTWKSHSLGGDVNTGDGHLMAAEVGAHLSSMEFSNFYGMVPLGTSMDKNGFFIDAEYWDHTGTPIPYRDLHESRAELLAASLRGTITARFTAPPERREAMRLAMPNFFMVTDKLGVDPFRDRFPIDWVQEGTVRGTGGLHVLDRSGTVGVPGLYAAGDVAARDRIVGSATGAGGPNLAWAVATGTWAGRSAAAASGERRARPSDLAPAGTVGTRGARPVDWSAVVSTTQRSTLPVDRAGFRDAAGLAAAARELDDLWTHVSDGAPGAGRDAVRAREAGAMLAMARWSVHTAAHRTETRGMHTRTDHPDTDSAQTHRLLAGGLDDVWVHPDPELPVTGTRDYAEAAS